MKKLLKIISISSGFLGTLGGGIGIGVGVILPRALKARDSLSNYVSVGGSEVNLKSNLKRKGHLNVLALGDSLTAGYNGYLGLSQDTDETISDKEYTYGGDYYSYADFLVQSLRTALGGKEKVKYKNFARSGLKLADIKVILESAQVSRQLSQADIIPITIGANDILALLELFHMPFWGATQILPNSAKILESIDVNKLTIKDTPTFINILKSFMRGSQPNKNQVRGSSGISYSKSDSDEMREKTIQDLINISDGMVGGYLNIDKDWVDTIFQLVEREITTLIRDIHVAAPNAQIILLGHSMPFTQFPQDVLETKNVNVHNKSLFQNFDVLLNNMYAGSVNSIGSNNYVDFYKIDNLSEMKPYSWDLSSAKEETIKHGAKFKKVIYEKDQKSMQTYSVYKKINWNPGTTVEQYIQKAKSESNDIDENLLKEAINMRISMVENSEEKIEELFKTSIAKKYIDSIKNNPLPNIMDIHPSVFGHSLIGKSLFKIYSKKLGLTQEEIEKGNAVATPAEYSSDSNPLFEKEDENPLLLANSLDSAFIFNSLLSQWKNIPDGLLKSIEETIKNVDVQYTETQGNYNLADQKKNFTVEIKNNFMNKIEGIMKDYGISDDQIKYLKEISMVKNIMAKYLGADGKSDGLLPEYSWKYKLALIKFDILEKSENNFKSINDEQYLKWSLYKISGFMSVSQTVVQALVDMLGALRVLDKLLPSLNIGDLLPKNI